MVSKKTAIAIDIITNPDNLHIVLIGNCLVVNKINEVGVEENIALVPLDVKLNGVGLHHYAGTFLMHMVKHIEKKLDNGDLKFQNILDLSGKKEKDLEILKDGHIKFIMEKLREHGEIKIISH